MNQELKALLIKRAKSFAWRLGCYIVVAILGFIGQQLELFQLSPTLLAFIGLILGEATKFVNNHTGLFGGRLK